MSGLVQLTIIAWLSFASAAILATAAVYPWLRKRLPVLGPETRARVITWIVVAPVSMATALTFACFLPSLITQSVGVADHCNHHGELHAHFCWMHRASQASTLGWWIASAASGGVIVLMTVECLRIVRAQARARSFEPFAMVDANAFTIGLLRPRIIVGSALRETLPSHQLDAVIAHEQAHVQRHDNLRKAMVHVFSRFHFPSTRAALLDDLDWACEQSCDRYASTKLGDALVVAEAILAVERLSRSRKTLLAVSAFGASRTEERIGALLAYDETPRDDERSLRRWFAVVTVLTIALAVPLHDWVEDFVSLLGH